MPDAAVVKEPAPGFVFTDLDGTLLDHDTYESGPAAEALARLQQAGVLVIFCSAKTRAEQEPLRERLEVTGPFIVENGAAAFLPGPAAGEPDSAVPTETVTFGLPYQEVRRGLRQAASEAGVMVRGYGDMTAEELSSLTGLEPDAAIRAQAREFTETFVIQEPSPEAAAVLGAGLRARGLRMIRGARFWTATGDHDKGTAVRYLLHRLTEKSGPVTSYGIGDFGADLEMLAAVDVPMLVMRPDGSWANLELPDLVRLEGVGPKGWSRAAEHVLAALGRPPVRPN
ncbi:MAG: HAD-IIB family hydrolase [Acidimicrobiia bacterium]